VTAVTVVPAHRRRGLLTAMMRRQLDDVRAGGEPVAALWASEAAIYGRFGYAPATAHAHLVARRPAARLAAHAQPSPRADPVRAGPAAEHLEAMREVHARVVPTRPGMLDRPGAWWEDRLHDSEADRGGAQPLQAVVCDDGYALYGSSPAPTRRARRARCASARSWPPRRRRARWCGRSCSTRT
jgi:predicted acetyltransferase